MNATPTRHEQLRALIEFGYREKTIADWSDDRIATVLKSRRRDARLAVARAANKANNIDGTNRGQPSQLERDMAAAFLEESLDRGPDEIVNAVLYVGHALTDAEARVLAEGLISLFRGQHETQTGRIPFPEPDEAA